MTERQDIRRLQQGLRRVKGASGADGADGIDGVDGATGPTGLTGPAGVDGVDGADGIDGAIGATGPDGADGEGVALGGTTNQALTKIDGVDFNTDWSTINNSFVGSEPADNTILKDADIGDSVQAFSSSLDTYVVNSLTTAELGELQNINTVTITNAQWAFLGAFNQGLTTASNVSFGTGLFSGNIRVGGNIILKAVGNRELQLIAPISGVNAFIRTVLTGAGINFQSNNLGGSNFEDMLILNGVTLSATFPGAILVDDTTDSTSTTTGSIQTDGGLGVVKNLHVGGEVFLNLPTSAGTVGSLWNDAGTVKVA